jgi:hypothetical protein
MKFYEYIALGTALISCLMFVLPMTTSDDVPSEKVPDISTGISLAIPMSGEDRVRAMTITPPKKPRSNLPISVRIWMGEDVDYPETAADRAIAAAKETATEDEMLKYITSKK